MRTLTDATLYTVNGPRGTYYALLDHDSGEVLNAATETAAAALANQRDMVIVDQLSISQEKLLKLARSRGFDLSDLETGTVEAVPNSEIPHDLLSQDTVPAHANQ